MTRSAWAALGDMHCDGLGAADGTAALSRVDRLDALGDNLDDLVPLLGEEAVAAVCFTLARGVVDLCPTILGDVSGDRLGAEGASPRGVVSIAVSR